jgi:hypothetical protein
MHVDWEEQFSKRHPLKIKDTDLFLHGTSSKKYSTIQRTGFLLRKVPDRNWGVSRTGICFEKYVERGQYCAIGAASFVDRTIRQCCEVACENDNSSEGIVLQIRGRELKKLGCPIYADWNKPYAIIVDSEGMPIDVDPDAPVLSIIIIDRDVPLGSLEVVKRLLIDRKLV